MYAATSFLPLFSLIRRHLFRWVLVFSSAYNLCVDCRIELTPAVGHRFVVKTFSNELRWNTTSYSNVAGGWSTVTGTLRPHCHTVTQAHTHTNRCAVLKAAMVTCRSRWHWQFILVVSIFFYLLFAWRLLRKTNTFSTTGYFPAFCSTIYVSRNIFCIHFN